MYAVIQTGGKQYRVEPDQTVLVEKLAGNAGDKIVFDEVLLVSSGDGEEGEGEGESRSGRTGKGGSHGRDGQAQDLRGEGTRRRRLLPHRRIRSVSSSSC